MPQAVVLRRGVRFQMNADEVFSGYHDRVVVYNHRLGKCIVGWGRSYPALLHSFYASEGNEDTFGAPVATATESYFVEFHI